MDAEAQFELGNQLSTLGHNQRAVELTRQALAGDPRNAAWHSWLSIYLAALGQLNNARTAIDTAIGLQPDAVPYRQRLAIIEVLRGDAKAALAAALQEPPGAWHDVAMALALQAGSDHAAADAALANLSRKYAGTMSYQIAQVHALRHDPDAMFRWLDHAWDVRDPGIGNLLSDPLILRYRDDPRFAAYAKKLGLPVTTDAVAMKL